MADEKINENQDDQKMYNNEEVQEMIKKRLKNKSLENEELKAQLEAIQAQAQQPSNAVQSQPQSEEMNAENPQEGQSFSPDAMRQAMREEMGQQLQQQQQVQAQQHHINNVQKMYNEDEKFKKLTDKFAEDNKKVPPQLAIELSKNLTHEQAKKAFMKIMGNDLAYYRMHHAFNSAMSGDHEAYNQWLNGLLSDSKPEGEAPEVVPDLRESTIPTSGSRNQGALNYLKNRY